MTAALVQQATNTSTGSATLVVTLSATGAGNTLIALIANNNASISSVADDKGNTWVADFTPTAAHFFIKVFRCQAPTTGTVTVTITFANSTGSGLANVCEWSGFAASPLDTTNNNNGTGVTTISTNSATPSQATNVGFAIATHTGGVPSAGPTDGFTGLTLATQGTQRLSTGYIIQAAATARNPTWTVTSTAYDSGIVFYKQTAAGATLAATTPVAVSTPSAALTTAIKLAATTPVAVSTPSAALTTAIRLAASTALQFSVSASLTALQLSLGVARATVGRFGHRAQATVSHVFGGTVDLGAVALQGETAMQMTLAASALTTAIKLLGACSISLSTPSAALVTGSGSIGAILNATTAIQFSSTAGLTTAPPGYASTRITDVNLVSYWRLGESSGTTMTDLNGLHDGVYVNSPTLGVAGAISSDSNTAADFTGASPGKYATVAGLTMPLTPTLEAWASASAWSDMGLIGQWTDSGGCMLFLSSSGAVSLYVNATPLTTSVNSSWLSGYHYIVGTYDGTTAKIYVDGALQTSGALTGPINPTGTFTIGKYGAGIHPFPGKIDEAAVSSQPRSAADILTQFNAADTTVSASTPAVYLAGVNANTKANVRIGDTNHQKASYRFRASTSSAPSTINFQQRGGTGYSSGTGGTLKIDVFNDDGAGKPTGSSLGTVSYAPGIPSGGVYITKTFGSTTALVKGNLYHITFQNTDANDAANFISINETFIYGGVISPRQPKWPDTDNAVLTSTNGGAWSVAGQYTADFDLTYANGIHDGNGYVGMIGTGSGTNPLPTGSASVDYANITGTTSMARERFVVSGGAKTVTGGTLFMRRTSGSADLVVGLYATSGDSLIEAVSILATSVAISSPGGDTGGMTRVSFSFASSHILANGTGYYLRLSTTAGTTYTVSDIRKGGSASQGSFNTTTFFADGEGEYTTNSGGSWSRAYTGDGSFGQGPDWMFSLTLV